MDVHSFGLRFNLYLTFEHGDEASSLALSDGSLDEFLVGCEHSDGPEFVLQS